MYISERIKDIPPMAPDGKIKECSTRQDITIEIMIWGLTGNMAEMYHRTGVLGQLAPGTVED
jgi:hypothetical protein